MVMTTGDKHKPQPAPSEGNASNPAPDESKGTQADTLFGEKAEKYLKESGNIEDMPDAGEDQAAIDKTREK